MTLSEIGRRRDGRNDATSRCTCTIKYFIDTSDQVCRLTFIDTFQITKRRVETIQNKIKITGAYLWGAEASSAPSSEISEKVLSRVQM